MLYLLRTKELFFYVVSHILTDRNKTPRYDTPLHPA